MKLAKFSLTPPIVAISVALCAAFSSFAAPTCKVTLTTSGYAGSEALANFPMLVKFAEGSPVGFSYSQFKPDAADLAFEDAEGNPLYFDVDTWNPNGTSFIWVRVPSLTKTTQIVAKWGDEAVIAPTEYRSGAKVWGETGYAGVWHMNETENQGTVDYNALDASGNGMTAVPMKSGTTDFTPMVSNKDGAIGLARVNQSAADRKIGLKVDGYKDIASEIEALGVVSVSGWFYVPANNKNARVMAQKKAYNDNNGFEIEQSGVARVTGSSPTISCGGLPTGKWNYIALAIRGASEQSSIFLNGTETKGLLTAIVANDMPFTIGNDGDCSEVNYVGSYDEVRIFKGAFSSDWMKAEYGTVANASFYEAGEVVISMDPDMFIVKSDRGEEAGEVSPAYGTTKNLADGQVVPFSAPEVPVDLGNGKSLAYAGYELYAIEPGGSWELLASSAALSGNYKHVAGKTARLVWRQVVFSSYEPFATTCSSIVSIPGYASAETQCNLPVLVKISEGQPEGFSYADCQANGADILFTESNGVVIPHEIEKWDPEGVSFVWVGVPVVRTGTTFRFCYGNANITTAQNDPTKVWSDAGYAGVWHLNEAATTDNALDATGSGLNGVPTSRNNGAAEMTSAAGIVAGARQIATTAANWFAVPSSPAFDLGSVFTVSAWICGTGTSNARVLGHKSAWDATAGWEVQWNAVNQVTVRGSSGGSAQKRTLPNSADTWTQVAWVFDKTTASLYANGAKVADDTVTPVLDVAEPFCFGNSKLVDRDTYVYKGLFDEVRLTGGAASATRLKAEYDMVANDGFVALGKVSQAAESDIFVVETGDVERGVVSPAWGTMTGLTDGQVVPFSAPEGPQETDDPTMKFCFSGYALYVTKNGSESLVERKSAVSGSYTHVAGQGVRLVWFTQDLPQVAVEVSGAGSVTGAGFLPIGSTVTLTAVPEAGHRFMGWSGELPDGVNAADPTISFSLDKPYALAVKFAEKPAMAAFYGWAGHTDGETVTVAAAGDDSGSQTFAASGVNLRGTNVTLPTFASFNPGVIYTDATCTEVLAQKPGSIHFFSSTPPGNNTTGGGEVVYPGLVGWISRQKRATLEMFVRNELYTQYACAWSYTADGDKCVLFCSDGSDYEARFSVEKTVSGTTGSAKSTTAAQGATLHNTESWQHLAVMFDNETHKVVFYRNYCRVGEKSIVLNEHAVGEAINFYLGSEADATHCFTGWIAAMRVSAGEMVPDDFMRAQMPDATGDTMALFSFRGTAGEPVTTLKPINKDGRDLFSACPHSASLVPLYGASAPGEALFDNAAACEAKEVRSRRIGSIVFPGTNNAFVVFQSLSTAISQCDDYTIEFFERCGAESTWKAAISWNDTHRQYNAKPNEVQIPGMESTMLTFQNYQPNGEENKAHLGTGKSLMDGAWHHVAVTYTKSSDMFRLYYDYGSAPAAKPAYGSRSFTAAPLLLGGMLGDANALKGERFVGEISCLRVSKKALQPSEFLRAAPRPDSGLMLLVR